MGDDGGLVGVGQGLFEANEVQTERTELFELAEVFHGGLHEAVLEFEGLE